MFLSRTMMVMIILTCSAIRYHFLVFQHYEHFNPQMHQVAFYKVTTLDPEGTPEALIAITAAMLTA